MWSSQKNIFNTLNSIFVEQKFELYPEFRNELKKNYENFLKNKPPLADERDKVKRANKDPLQLFGGKVNKTIQPSIIEEALTISDLFSLSELAAVELLLEAEEQMQYFHGYNRGLTSILLYYDTKKIYVNNLRTLTLARKGRTWVFDETLSAEITKMNSEFVDGLLHNGLVSKILNQIELFDWLKSEEQLLKVNGLGSLKHRKEVKSLFEEIRVTLAECVYNCACQVPLSHTDVIAIINFLKKNGQYSSQSKNVLDLTHIYLVMAILYCFDYNFSPAVKLETDSLDTIKSLTQNNGLKNLYTELNKSDFEEWTIPGIKSIIQFSFHIFLTVINSVSNETRNTLNLDFDGIKFEENQKLIDLAVEKKVFSLIDSLIVKNDRFHYEKYFVERIHNLMTDFICKMPEKIKDLKRRNEEFKNMEEMGQHGTGNLSFHSDLQANIFAGNLSSYAANQSQARLAIIANHDFEEFLNLLGNLYSNDPLKLELCLNYWSADNQSNMDMNFQNPSQKQISLYKFLRYFLSSDITSSSIYISYINLLTGLSSGEESSQHCFIFLQNNSQYNDMQSPTLRISLNHILNAFERYYEFFKMDFHQNQLSRQQQTLNLSQSKTQQFGLNKGIVQNELQGLISVCKLMNQIIKNNEKIRVALFELQYGENSVMNNYSNVPAFSYGDKLNKLYQPCSFPNLMFGLLTCPIPTALKGEIFRMLANFSATPQIALNMWSLLENSQILQTVPVNFSAQVFVKNDIKVELEEIESRDETYPAIKGFLELITSLLNSSDIPENLGVGLRSKDSILGFQPYLQFLIKCVYLKIFYRVYKNTKEKWEITNYILDVFFQIISKFEISQHDTAINPNQSKFILSSPGYCLLYELTHDSSILKMLFFILNETLVHLQEYNVKNEPMIEQAALKCLKIVAKVIEKQSVFIDLLKALKLNTENSGIEKFLININPKTNRTDYLIMIFSFIKFNSSLIKHSNYVLSIIIMLSEYKSFSNQHLNLFLKSCSSASDQNELVSSFVEILEYDDLYETSQQAAIFKSFKDSIDEIDLQVNNYEKIANALVSDDKEENESNSMEELRSLSRLKALKILLFYIKLPAPNLSLLLLGMDINKPLKNQSFYNPGTRIDGIITNKEPAEVFTIIPRNCLHSVIRILNRLLKDPANLFSIANSVDMAYELINTLCLNPMLNQQLLFYLRNEFDFVYKHLKQIPLRINEFEMELSERSLNFDVKQLLNAQYSWVMNLVSVEMQNLTANKNKTQLKRLVQLLIENTDENGSSMTLKSELKSKEIQDNFNFNNKIFNLLMITDFSEIPPEPLDLNYFDPQLIEKVIDTCKFKPEYNSNMRLFDIKKIKNILLNEIGDSNANSSKINLINELKYILQIVFERNQFQYQFLNKKKFFESFKTIVEALIALTPSDIFSLNARYTFITSLIEKLFEKINTDDVFPELTYPVGSVLFILVKNLRDVIDKILKQKSADDTATQKQQFFNIPEIFENLIDYLLNQNVTNFNVRTYLYAAIINYLMIYNYKSDEDTKSIEYGFEEESIRKKLNKPYSNLFKTICSDSCEGSLNLSTMMGYSILNKILKFDTDHKWLKFINDNGYLSCIINTISNTDNQLLEELFHSESNNDKIIYIFESKLSFLLSISKSSQGSQLLLKNDLIGKLISCSIFSQRKNFERNILQSQLSYLTIQLLHQYYKILFPTLKLIISILNSSGCDNIQAKSEVSKFVLKFNDSFVHILTSRQTDIKMLEELKLVTCLLCKIAPFDELIFDQTDSYLIIECNSAMSRIKKEFNNLISLYFVPDQIKTIKKDIEKSNFSNTDNLSKLCDLHFSSVAINLSKFLAANVKRKDLNWSSIIFDSIIDINETKNSIYNISSKNINLGLLISFIKFSIENMEKNLETDSDLLNKQKNLKELSELEKKQIIGDSKLAENLSENEKKIALNNILKNKIKSNKEDFKNLKSLIERNLHLLWRHIEFYFHSFSNLNIQDVEVRNGKLSNEEFFRFRQNLNCALNQNFFKRIIDLNQQSNTEDFNRNDFINTIVKRIQRLMHLNSN